MGERLEKRRREKTRRKNVEGHFLCSSERSFQRASKEKKKEKREPLPPFPGFLSEMAGLEALLFNAQDGYLGK